MYYFAASERVECDLIFFLLWVITIGGEKVYDFQGILAGVEMTTYNVP